jgi:hypothetical protein
MTTRHLTTAVTMAVLCVILVIGAVVGFNALFAPLPGSEEEQPAAAPTESCVVEPVRKGRKLRTGQVVVNVFNGGTRAGLAGQTMDALRSRGFQGGQIGNAPRKNKVKRVQIWIEEGEEAAGRLVARQFGPKTPVMTPKEDLANGVDVVVGNNYRTLQKGPRFVVVKQPPENTCS